MRNVNQIIVHCSATIAGEDYHASDIDLWHKSRGFHQIGYHYVIALDGSVENGRPLWIPGAHCEGFNAQSIGICYIGGLDSSSRPFDTRTEAQKKALLHLINYLCTVYPITSVVGHYQVRKGINKCCPCFDAEREYRSLCESLGL